MKRLISVIFIMIITFIFMENVSAAGGYISVSGNKSVVVGSTFKVTTKVSAPNLGSWEYCISYDSSILKLESGDACVKNVVGNGGTSETFTFKAIKSGTAKVSVRSYAIIDFDSEQEIQTSVGSLTVTAKTQAEIEASYSKNNNLKSLGVDGYELTPAFSNDVKEYTVNVPSEVTKINITAPVEDGTASVEGAGEKDVVEGSNTFDIVVTAQNGNQNTFKLTVNVEDKNPIKVTYNGDDYTVVKRTGLFEAPKGFTETTVKIDDFDVPALYNEVTKKTLVGLRNEEGKVLLFEYNDGKYTRYYEFTFSQITLNIIKMDEKLLPSGYSKYNEKINDEKIDVYKYSKDSKFALVYGIDVSTGEKNLYQVDLKNNSIQLFNDELIGSIKETNNRTLLIFAIAGGIILLEFLMILSSRKKNKKILDRIQNNKVEKVKNKAIKDAEKETVDFKEEEETKTILDKTAQFEVEEKGVRKEKKKKSK